MITHRSRILPRLSMIAGVLLLLVLAIHFVGVALLRYFVERELHPALPQGTYVGEVHLNLFSGVLNIEDFELRDDRQLRMRFTDLVLDISPWRLLAGEVHLEHAEIGGAYVRVDRRPDGSFDLGLPPFAAASDDSGPGAAAPAFSMSGIRLNDVVIDYRDGELASVVDVDSLAVGPYATTEAEQQVPVDWRMHWDHKEIAGDATVWLSGDRIGARGRLRTALLDLVRTQQLARLAPQLHGELAFDGGFDWEPPRLVLRGDIESPELLYQFAGRKVALSGVVFPGFALELTTAPELLVAFSPGNGARAATWETELEGQRVTGRSIGLSGSVRYAGTGTLDASDLDYRAEQIAWKSGGRELRIKDAALSGRAQQSLAGDTPIPALNVSLTASLIEYSDTPAAIAARIEDMAMIDLALSPLDEARGRRLGGELRLGASRISRAGTTIDWSAVGAVLGGRVSREAAQLAADVGVDSLRVADPLLHHGPLNIDRIAANGVALGGAPGFDRLRVDRLSLPSRPAETGLRVAAIDIDSGLFSDEAGFTLGQIVIDGVQTAVIRDEQGQWRYPMSPQADAPGASEAKPAAGPASQGGEGNALHWRIGGLRITGDSHVMLADHLNPDMSRPVFRIERFKVGALASDRPDADTPFEVTLRPDQYSEFLFEGRVRPLAGQPYIVAEGHLHGFGLSTVNGLVADDLGHRFVAGQLDNDFSIAIEDNRLEMGNALGLAGVSVEEIAGKEGPPLATAIALLEDRDGNIRLEVPVSGDLSDPDFRVLGALNPIIMKAVAGTAALAIQPLGSVLLVGGLLADQALKVTFEPALFAPGETVLNPAARKYLAQLAGKLTGKPKLALRVCGVAVEKERRKDKKGAYIDKEDDLLAMAQRRADAARAYLQEQGVGTKQLRACRPAYDPQADAKPRVDIRL